MVGGALYERGAFGDVSRNGECPLRQGKSFPQEIEQRIALCDEYLTMPGRGHRRVPPSWLAGSGVSGGLARPSLRGANAAGSQAQQLIFART